ncbi:MAG: hypothetical protein GEU74_11370, partial [Nitriliruptorales bacterium]|nr:hypothetical protein [Nitriliruptorales bacterium]
MIICQVCGYQNEDDDTFCGGCPAYLPHSGVRVDDDLQPIAEEPDPELEPGDSGGLIRRVKEMVGMESDAAPAGAVLVQEGPTETETEIAEATATAQLAEVEAKAREEEARQAREAERKAREEAAARAAAEQQARDEADAAARSRAEAEERARAEAQAKAKAEAEERERQAAAERAEAEARAKALREAEERAAAQRRAREAAEAAAAAEQEEAERARKEAEVAARREAEERARREAQAQAEAEEEARRRAENAAREREEAERKAEEEANRRAAEKAEAERKAEQQARRRAEEEERARQAAEKRAEEERLAREKAEKEAAEAAERARRAAAMVAKAPAPAPARARTGAARAPAVAAAAAPAAAATGAAVGTPAAVKPTEQRPVAPPPRPPKGKTPPSRRAEPGDIICGHCGEPNRPERKFCRRCATSLAEAEVVKIPLWRRMFTRKKKTVAVGERPGRAGRDGSKAPARHRVTKGARTIVRWFVALVLIAMMLFTIAGALGVGPGRGFIKDKLSSITERVRGVVAPQIDPVNPHRASSSSETSGHPADHAIDGFDNTHWASGVEVSARPALTMTFAEPVDLARVGFHSGASGDAFRKQARPKEIRLLFPDGTRSDLQLKDVPDFQTFNIDATRARQVRLLVRSVHPGS